MRYLLDEDLSTEICVIARGLGVDIVTVLELDRRGWSDEQHLEQAAREGRCVITANRDDFRHLTGIFAAEGRPHTGVLIVPHTLRRQSTVAIARAVAAFDHARGDFPSDYLCDFLHPAERYSSD